MGRLLIQGESHEHRDDRTAAATFDLGGDLVKGPRVRRQLPTAPGEDHGQRGELEAGGDGELPVLAG
jgi:hypothetical protein